MALDEHLFRRESGRLVAALTRIFGVHNLALAEDVVQDAFCRALEVWKVRGIPENPAAWLMSVAKHRAVDIVRRFDWQNTSEDRLRARWTAGNRIPTATAITPITTINSIRLNPRTIRSDVSALALMRTPELIDVPDYTTGLSWSN